MKLFILKTSGEIPHISNDPPDPVQEHLRKIRISSLYGAISKLKEL